MGEKVAYEDVWLRERAHPMLELLSELRPVRPQPCHQPLAANSTSPTAPPTPRKATHPAFSSGAGAGLPLIFHFVNCLPSLSTHLPTSSGMATGTLRRTPSSHPSWGVPFPPHRGPASGGVPGTAMGGLRGSHPFCASVSSSVRGGNCCV